MIISLIGMSGSGKSHWSKQLEQKGFQRFSIDNLLEEDLSYGLRELGYEGLIDLAQWMRQPFDHRYQSTSSTYLAYEKKAMRDVLKRLQELRNENIVIDTTGSVIYTGEEILNLLSALSRIVYLDTPATVQKEMYELYLKDPKPVIWGDKFSMKKGETPLQALARCYPSLLTFRTNQYKKLADVVLDYNEVRSHGFTIEHFLQKIQ